MWSAPEIDFALSEEISMLGYPGLVKVFLRKCTIVSKSVAAKLIKILSQHSHQTFTTTF